MCVEYVCIRMLLFTYVSIGWMSIRIQKHAHVLIYHKRMYNKCTCSSATDSYYTFTFPFVIAIMITIRVTHNPSIIIAKTARAA